MLRQTRRIVALLPLCVLPACASMIEGSTQIVTVDTNPRVQGNCVAANERGEWVIPTIPGTAEVKRSKSPLRVRCEGMGMKGVFNTQSHTEGWGYGNVATVGIGAGVDGATGALYEYPATIVVPMMADSAAAGATQPVPMMQQQGFQPAPVPPFGTMPPAPVVPGGAPPAGAVPGGPMPPLPGVPQGGLIPPQTTAPAVMPMYAPQPPGAMVPPPGLPQLPGQIPPQRALSPQAGMPPQPGYAPPPGAVAPAPYPPQSGYAPPRPPTPGSPASMQPGYPKQ